MFLSGVITYRFYSNYLTDKSPLITALSFNLKQSIIIVTQVPSRIWDIPLRNLFLILYSNIGGCTYGNIKTKTMP